MIRLTAAVLCCLCVSPTWADRPVDLFAPLQLELPAQQSHLDALRSWHAQFLRERGAGGFSPVQAAPWPCSVPEAALETYAGFRPEALVLEVRELLGKDTLELVEFVARPVQAHCSNGNVSGPLRFEAGFRAIERAPSMTRSYLINVDVQLEIVRGRVAGPIKRVFLLTDIEEKWDDEMTESMFNARKRKFGKPAGFVGSVVHPPSDGGGDAVLLADGWRSEQLLNTVLAKLWQGEDTFKSASGRRMLEQAMQQQPHVITVTSAGESAVSRTATLYGFTPVWGRRFVRQTEDRRTEPEYGEW